MIATAVLLAGGQGTRLARVSEGLPKPMVPVAGRPFVEYVLDWLVDTGIQQIVMAVSFRAEVLRQHFGSAYRNVPIAYSVESEPLGTGGAILQCFRQFAMERAVVANADTLFPIDLGGMCQAHTAAAASLTIALRAMADASRYGVVQRNEQGLITGFEEKRVGSAGLINGGVYLIERSALERFGVPGAFSFERDVLQKHVSELRPLGYVSDGYFIDIGIPEDLDRARRDLANA